MLEFSDQPVPRTTLKDKLFGATRIPLLGKALDAYSRRHRAIADNVANAETIGYTRKRVQFEDKLKQAMGRGGLRESNPSHISGGLVRIGQTTSELARSELRSGRDLIALSDGRIRADRLESELEHDRVPSDVNDLNNVDIDVEMSDMAQNHLSYTFAAKMDRKFFDMIKMSIRGA